MLKLHCHEHFDNFIVYLVVLHYSIAKLILKGKVLTFTVAEKGEV